MISANPGAAAPHLEAPGATPTAGAARASDSGADRARRALAELRRELESLHKLLEN